MQYFNFEYSSWINKDQSSAAENGELSIYIYQQINLILSPKFLKFMDMCAQKRL